MLSGFWYRALPSDAVFRERLEQAMLLETPLVIGRDAQGRPFALHDACPHRGMPLSCGRFDGSRSNAAITAGGSTRTPASAS